MNSSVLKPSTLLLFFYSFLCFCSPTKADYIYSVCSNHSEIASNSYKTNLNSLFSSLTTKGPLTGFYNTTSGKTPDEVFGLVLCRGDDTSNDCQICIKEASQELLQRCNSTKEGTIWYDECLLRYSSQNFFSSVTLKKELSLLNTISASDPIRFNTILGQLMDNISSEAAFSSSQMFATGEAVVSSLQKIYGLVQCTRDLSKEDCNDCLESSIEKLSSCCSGKQGGQVISKSCFLRYEVYPFFRGASTGATSPPPENAMVDGKNSTTTAPTATTKGNRKKTLTIALAIVIPIIVLLVIFIALWYCLLKRKTKKASGVDREIMSIESLLFDLNTIKAATDDFADSNKLGEGGFGPVYKGKLRDGQEIAVKRLSRTSGQGVEEFKNEIILVAKLQHRNLVRLLGCCFEGQERLLVYEFVLNTSLDKFLFDPTRRAQLDWDTRYKIISGVARGILYLHEDSRLRVIHRDIKASNVLLDNKMNPKISDFGVARMFDVDQTRANTNRIVGTYGYMSPEYAMQGQFSVKSDVFSFGVLLLEIVRGQKNSSFYLTDSSHDLLSYAWKLWTENRPLELVDSALGNMFPSNEVLKCIHIGLLCVQEDAADRPTMSSVAFMLNSYSSTLDHPAPPPLVGENRSKELHWSATRSQYSVNELDASEIEPR
ncbi:cysteine-rich receptor-like protein kinase 44 [Vitis vinifera]|nr:cysteine-rich receptor-like protein kinase 44 [Vitis vinifera]|eukprot:XP_003635324.3 PREDICTED: putative receptor-like protein kinase At4g00960 [Vitis vinifera]